MTTATAYEQILFEQKGRVGIISLNRPEKLNAWTWEMNGEIADALERCNRDDSVGAIVITGQGRGFCAGADMQVFNAASDSGDESTGVEQPSTPQRRLPLEGLHQQSKPILAAVNGPAIGVGLTMTLTMDLRIASDRARFSMRFVRMGVTPEALSSLYLPQVVGLANALELALTGRIIDADEALRFGLVSRVVPHDELMARTMELAAEIAANPSDAVFAAKQLLHRNMVESDHGQVARIEGRVIQEQYESAGHKEAVRAFIEKREPRFNQPA